MGSLFLFLILPLVFDHLERDSVLVVHNFNCSSWSFLKKHCSSYSICNTCTIHRNNLITALVALVLYPVCFARELSLGNRVIWEFGWAYGVAWGAAIFLFGASVLLMCDRESEEVYYKERDVNLSEKGSN